MLRIVAYYKYEICILWKMSTGPFFGYIEVGVCNGAGRGGSLYKDVNFLVSQHKANENI